MSRSYTELLRHILDEADFLLRASRGVSREEFLHSETLRRAFVHSLAIIGEAAKGVPKPIRQREPEIEWQKMAGMRDRLIHHYFGVDYDLVWDVVINKIPQLRLRVRELLSEGPGGTGRGGRAPAAGR